MAIVRAERLLVAVALALVAICSSGALEAQERWTLGEGPHARQVSESEARGYAAIPLSSLVSLGVEMVSAGQDVRVRIAGREAVFTPESPFFRVGETIYQLVHPVYMESGVVYLPVQFLLEQLPLLAGPALEVDLATRRIVRAGDGRRAERDPEPDEPEIVDEPAPRPPTGPYLVVVDPGHGGRDPGAIGPGGSREKDVVLAVSRLLSDELRGIENFEVLMTRDRDTLIALADRRRIANRARANGQPALFVSIHANAASNRSARGFETFFLSEARTEDARRVAERENAAQRFEERPAARPDDPLEFIRSDLLINHYLHESQAWAGMIQDRLREVHPGPDRGVKRAGFVVLNGTLMPSVLVELGFITNPSEERMLTDRSNQRQLARQIAAAIRDYFESGVGSASEAAP